MYKTLPKNVISFFPHFPHFEIFTHICSLELELFIVCEIMVLQIIITIIANVINYINNLAKYSINTAKA